MNAGKNLKTTNLLPHGIPITAHTGSLPTITEFESGKKYVYFVMLKQKNGYSFSSETAVTVNGESVKSSLSGEFLYLPAVKTITMPTIKVIDVVEVNDVTVSFKDGDKPVFTVRCLMAQTMLPLRVVELGREYRHCFHRAGVGRRHL